MGATLPDGKITLRLFSVSRINDFSEIAHTFILLFLVFRGKKQKAEIGVFFPGI